MTLLAFQQAFCELIASPRLCLAVREDPAPFLSRYELSPREQDRLRDMVWQRGMSTTCSVYRSNRITPLYTMLPHTFTLLGDALEPLLDAYWTDVELRDIEFHQETERFAHFLRQRLASGALDDPFVAEVLAFELAVNELRYAPRRAILAKLRDADTIVLHPLVRVVRFAHDPDEVLGALARGEVPHGIAESESYLVLSAIDEELAVQDVDPDTARLLWRLQERAPVPLHITARSRSSPTP